MAKKRGSGIPEELEAQEQARMAEQDRLESELSPEQAQMKGYLDDLNALVVSLQVRPEDRVRFAEISERIAKLAGM